MPVHAAPGGETAPGMGDGGTPPPVYAQHVDDCERIMQDIDEKIIRPINECLAYGLASGEVCDETFLAEIRTRILEAEGLLTRKDCRVKESLLQSVANLYAQAIQTGYQIPELGQLQTGLPGLPTPTGPVSRPLTVPGYYPSPVGLGTAPPDERERPVSGPSTGELPGLTKPQIRPVTPEPTPPERPQATIPKPIEGPSPTPPIQVTCPPVTPIEIPVTQQPLIYVPAPIVQVTCQPPQVTVQVERPAGLPAPTGPVSPRTSPPIEGPPGEERRFPSPDLGPTGNILANPDDNLEESRLGTYFGGEISRIYSAATIEDNMTDSPGREPPTAAGGIPASINSRWGMR